LADRVVSNQRIILDDKHQFISTDRATVLSDFVSGAPMAGGRYNSNVVPSHTSL
jgi:hypothetical protein